MRAPCVPPLPPMVWVWVYSLLMISGPSWPILLPRVTLEHGLNQKSMTAATLAGY